MDRVGKGNYVMKLTASLVLSLVLLAPVCLAAEVPQECREYQTPLGLDAGRISRGLRSDDWRARSRAVRCLTLTEQAAELISPVATDPDPRVKRMALYALGEKRIPARLYAQLLGDTDPLVRAVAAEFAYLSGPSAVDALITSAASTTTTVEERVLSLKSLEKLGRTALSSRSYLFKLLSDNSEPVRIAAARVLGVMGPDASDAVPFLEKSIAAAPRESLEYHWMKETLVRVDPARWQR
jgi:hypothetical protein